MSFSPADGWFIPKKTKTNGKEADPMEGDRKQYPEGYFVSTGLALGMVAGLLFSVIIHNPDLFIIGLPVGLALGAAAELKFRKEGRIRPLTPEETQRRTIMVIAAVALFIAGIIVFLVFP